MFTVYMVMLNQNQPASMEKNSMNFKLAFLIFSKLNSEH
jgi:hypothetical protein